MVAGLDRVGLTVQDDGDFLAVPGCEDVVEECGFACSEVACGKKRVRSIKPYEPNNIYPIDIFFHGFPDKPPSTCGCTIL